MGGQIRCLVRKTGGPAELAGLPAQLVYGDVVDVESLRSAVLGCEAMVDAKAPQRFVLCRYLAASGPSSLDRPRREEDPLCPQEWYGESKAEAERIASSFAAAIDVAVARPCRILSPGDRENLIFFRMVKKGFQLSVAGGPRPISMVDVEDVASFLLLLATRCEALAWVKTYAIKPKRSSIDTHFQKRQGRQTTGFTARQRILGARRSRAAMP